MLGKVDDSESEPDTVNGTELNTLAVEPEILSGLIAALDAIPGDGAKLVVLTAGLGVDNTALLAVTGPVLVLNRSVGEGVRVKRELVGCRLGLDEG